MKLTNKLTPLKRLTFYDLKAGEAFYYKNTSTYYVKVVCENSDNTNSFAALELSSNRVIKNIDIDAEVFKINAEIILTNP